MSGRVFVDRYINDPILSWKGFTRSGNFASLESIDTDIVAPVLAHLEKTGEPYRLLVTPDHPTYLSTKTHTHGDVPFTICGTGIDGDSFDEYHEVNAAASELAMPNGWELMPFFLKKD